MEKAIEDAADKVDAEHNSKATTTATDDESKEPNSVKGMLKLLHRHSDGTNVMKESIKTFSNPDGSDKKGDLMVTDKQEGLMKLKELVEADKTNPKKKKKAAKWDFRASPHEQFGKTLDDTFAAFVQWAKAKTTPSGSTISDDDDNNNNDNDETAVSYNVSKAFRRLESYAEWMEETAQDLVEPTLTAPSVKTALDAWAMKCSIDKNGNFCWWFDMEQIDKKAIKSSISPTESLRAFVWYAHYVMYDPNAQANGILFIENVNKMGFLQTMTLAPMKLSVKLDRLTIGVLPVKMKAMYILESPTWMDILMKFMAMFMSKKMQGRIKNLKEWNKLEELVGNEAIPKNFGKLEGHIEVDPVDAKYFSE